MKVTKESKNRYFIQELVDGVWKQARFHGYWRLEAVDLFNRKKHSDELSLIEGSDSLTSFMTWRHNK
tara:strand:+ start:438 stop:638 length:201 start_codon:yes stop_codon:yes gene_type:complete